MTQQFPESASCFRSRPFLERVGRFWNQFDAGVVLHGQLSSPAEEKAYPIDLPDPITALRFRMEQAGLRPKDLIPYIGSKSKVSEVMSGRRPLSLTMIRKLVAGLHFPAELALQVPTGSVPRRKSVRSRRLQTAPAR